VSSTNGKPPHLARDRGREIASRIQAATKPAKGPVVVSPEQKKVLHDAIMETWQRVHPDLKVDSKEEAVNYILDFGINREATKLLETLEHKFGFSAIDKWLGKNIQLPL
jgi:hypothetical protein